MVITMAQSFAKRVMFNLIDGPNQSHDEFPTSILDGIQSPSGASAGSLVELEQFIHQLFIFQLPKNFFIQMAVAGAFICVLVIVGLATIYSRIRQRAFWVFKATRRSEGIYLVPNALNTFLLFEGVFAALWLAFIIIQYEGYWKGVGAMQQHIATFNLIIWWPLWIGAFMAGWGSFYTAPGALDKGPLRSNGWVRYLPRPLMINIFCIGTPLVLIISLIPLIVLSQHHLNQAFAQYKIFSAEIQSTISAAGSNAIVASPDQANQLLTYASQIWSMQVKTGYYLAIGYAIWPVWAAIFLLFYTPAGGYLVYLVWAQLLRQKRTLIELREKYIEEEAIERRKRELAIEDQIALGYHPYPKLGKNDSTKHNTAMRQIISLGVESALPDPSASLLFQPLTSSQERETTAVPEQGLTPPVTPSTFVQGRISHIHNGSSNDLNKSNGSSEDENQDVFFPPMKPELQKRAGTKRLSSVGGTPYTRYKYLRRCFINLTVLYVAIVLGAALYLGVSASLARYLYNSYRKGPKEITHIVYYACVISAWGAVVFGAFCIAAIMARFIDPANGPAMSSTGGGKDEENRGAVHKAFTRRTVTANSGLGLKNKLSITTASPFQDMTRTLPAVPESVGATMDELMTGISIPTSAGVTMHQTRSFGTSWRPQRMPSMEEVQSRESRIPRNRTLKFELHSRPEGGLLLEPSSESMGPFISTAASSFVEEEGLSAPSAIPTGRISTPTRIKQIKRKKNLPYIMAMQEGQPIDAPSSAVNSSTNSSQRSLASRRKYSLTEPTSAPPPPPPKPLAPARTPPLSPEYISFMQAAEGKQIGTDRLGDDRVSESDLRSRFSLTGPSNPSPPPRNSSFKNDRSPKKNMTEVVQAKPVTLPNSNFALLSGIPQESESHSAGPRSFSAQRQARGQDRKNVPSPIIAVTNDKSSLVSQQEHSPSVAISPISFRRSGLHSSISPFLPPASGLPPTPTSATAFTTFPSDDSPPGQAQQIYTDRQKVPMQADDWTPLAKGWFRIPDEKRGKDADSSDEQHILHPLENDEVPDMNVFASPRRPSLPLPDTAVLNQNSYPMHFTRRRSEANNGGLFF